MRKRRVDLGLVIVFGMLLSVVWGQNSSDFPYSRYGLGDPVSEEFIPLRSMGSISAAYSDPYYTNLANPASLGALTATSFEVGFNVFRETLKNDAGQKAIFSGGNLNYFSLAFPMINPVNRLLDRKSRDLNWGMGFALLPHSRVSHFSSVTNEVIGVGSVTHENEGSGGTNKVLWSNGVKYKDLYVGISLGYLFGSIKDEQAVLFNDMVLASNIYKLNEASYRSLLFKAGLQYELDLSNGKGKENVRDVESLTFGLSTSAGSKFTTLSNGFSALKRISANSSPYGGLADDIPDEANDTISISQDSEASGKLNSDLSVGVVYRRGSRWLAGASIKFIGGTKYENDLDDYQMQNAYRLSIGGQYVPDASSYNQYFKRALYTAGIAIGTDPRVVNDIQLKQFEINVGIGLPVVVSRQVSFINLGLTYGNYGGDIPIKESGIGFNLGVTLNNNLWFLKRKFE